MVITKGRVTRLNFAKVSGGCGKGEHLMLLQKYTMTMVDASTGDDG